MKIDMHTHTQEGSPCSRVPVKEMIDRLIQKEFDGALLTDHESIAGFNHYQTLFGKPEHFVLLRGFEYTTTLGDMLVILPTEEVLPYEELIGSIKEGESLGLPICFEISFRLEIMSVVLKSWSLSFNKWILLKSKTEEREKM